MATCPNCGNEVAKPSRKIENAVFCIAPTVTAILRQADITKLFRTLFFEDLILVR